MDHLEYLLSYGVVGDFGRFRALRPLDCRRGDRAVVRSRRGMEIAEVLRETVPNHAHFLPNTSVGQLLRLATGEDEHAAAELQDRSATVLHRGKVLAAELALPLEILDVELLLDRQNAVVHHLRWAECDLRPLVSALSTEFAVQIALTDLTRTEEEEHHGCGKEGCGGGEGGCGSCSSGGCGTCGTAKPEEVRDYFAGLRQHMEQQRTPLL